MTIQAVAKKTPGQHSALPGEVLFRQFATNFPMAATCCSRRPCWQLSGQVSTLGAAGVLRKMFLYSKETIAGILIMLSMVNVFTTFADLLSISDPAVVLAGGGNKTTENS